MRPKPLVASSPTLSRWLSGKTLPSERALQEFCNAFNQAVRVAGAPGTEIAPAERVQGESRLKAAQATPRSGPLVPRG